MMMNDDWLTSALTDDTVVVELLFRLKQSSSDSSHASLPAKPSPAALPPPLGWGHRQPRSKPAATARKDQEPTRFSPTTPLSWSGGGASSSPSDGSDSSACRSKCTFANESATATTNKRTRKRKMFDELKEEESMLLKESMHLHREFASLCATLLEQIARGENLKKFKLDLQLRGNKMGARLDEPVAAISSQCNQMEAPTIHQARSILPRHSTHDVLASSDSCKEQKDAKTPERYFVLPDLNMTPSEEESGPETLYGIS